MTLETPSIDDVRSVITTSLTDAQITALIADAALLAGRCSAISSESTAVQQAVVKWVTAHLIATTTQDGAVVTKKIGDAQETFARARTGMGLAGTHYGQQAILLDPTGCLERIGRKRAFVQVL